MKYENFNSHEKLLKEYYRKGFFFYLEELEKLRKFDRNIKFNLILVEVVERIF